MQYIFKLLMINMFCIFLGHFQIVFQAKCLQINIIPTLCIKGIFCINSQRQAIQDN